MDNFNENLTRFVAYAQGLIDNNFKVNGYVAAGMPVPQLTLDPGTKYIRIVSDDGRPYSRSVFGFVDKTNGNVLKAAGWKAPAKHARGNIADVDYKCATPWGIVYLR